MQNQRWIRVLLLAAAPSLVTLAFGHSVHAQDNPAAEPAPADVREAQSRFEKGTSFFEAKKFALALEEFKASYAKVPSPNSRLSMARCLAELGDAKSAYLEYNKVIAEVAARSDSRYAEASEAAKTERDELSGKLALVILNVSTDDPAATVTIAGATIDKEQWGKAVPVDPGTAEVVLSAPSKPPVTQSIAVAAGEKREVMLSFGGASSDPSSPTPPDDTPATPSAPSSLRPFAYAAAGVGVAGFITFAVAGAMSNATYSDLEKICNGPCPQSRADDVTAGKTQQAVANVGLVLGIAGVAAGTTLFVLSLRKPKQSDTTTTSLVFGPGTMGLQGRF